MMVVNDLSTFYVICDGSARSEPLHDPDGILCYLNGFCVICNGSVSSIQVLPDLRRYGMICDASSRSKLVLHNLSGFRAVCGSSA